MAFSEEYRRQVALLTRIIPLVDTEPAFALKGGTAINLFIRAMPRLSVDIDLVYLPPGHRDEALAAIAVALGRIAEKIQTAVNADVLVKPVQLLVRDRDGTRVKIEVNPVVRGIVFQPERKRVVPEVEDQFGYAEMNLVSWEDLYAGKIIAALDRQHPRDLFDVHHLLASEGLTRDLVRAVLVYLISHDRRIHEVLDPRLKDIANEFDQAFVGMTSEPVELKTLLAARENLIAELHAGLTPDDCAFLLSFKRGEPEWERLALDHVPELPAICWKLQNLEKLRKNDPEGHAELYGRLEETLRGVSKMAGK